MPDYPNPKLLTPPPIPTPISTPTPDEKERLLASYFGLELDDYRSRMKVLCDRENILKVPVCYEDMASFGIALAGNHEAFRKNKKGRRPLRKYEVTLNMKRASYIAYLKKEIAESGAKKRVFNRGLIEQAVRDGSHLFKQGGLDSLCASVAAGNSEWKKLKAQFTTPKEKTADPEPEAAIETKTQRKLREQQESSHRASQRWSGGLLGGYLSDETGGEQN